MTPHFGIVPEHLAEVAHSLGNILSDEFVLYTKTLNAHWNVEGPDFYDKHLFFEKQYTELFEMIDQVAERIRTLGHFAPGTLRQFLQLTHLTEASREKNDARSYIQLLLADHESLIMHLHETINLFAGRFKDMGTSDFVTGLMEKHQKMVWMLKAHMN